MKQDKNKFQDLLLEIQQLNEKYQIKDFTEEIKSLFKIVDISEENIQELLTNPFSGTGVLSDPSQQDKLARCIGQYHKIKKKYNYDSYVREGHALRKKFLRSRKDYIFNSNKFIRFVTKGKSSTLEKLNMDFAEQKFIAKWIDKLLKKIYPKTLIVEYETLDGNIETAEIAHHKVEVTFDYVHAPLIDRFVGEYLFNTFLLHSFYNAETEKYEYFAVKFIIKMYSKDNPMMQLDEE